MSVAVLPTGKLAKAVQVNLAYEMDGKMITAAQVKNAPCTNATFGAPCLDTYKLQADRDAVFVTYQLNTTSGFTPPPGAKVKLSGCYSKFSGSGRPWRTAKTLVAVRGILPTASQESGVLQAQVFCSQVIH